MTQVIPAIIVKNFKQLEERVSEIKDFVDLVQVDITDGVFTHNMTWPYMGDTGELASLMQEDIGLPFWEDIDYEFHLMIEKPEESIGQWIKIGASRIVVQLESVIDMQRIIDECRASQVGVGIAIKPSTDISILHQYISDIDCIQCMGNEELGRHGSPLDLTVVEKIKTLREQYPDIDIAIDIGVHLDTASMLVDAGVTKLVAGSAIFDSPNKESAIRDLEEA